MLQLQNWVQVQLWGSVVISTNVLPRLVRQSANTGTILVLCIASVSVRCRAESKLLVGAQQIITRVVLIVHVKGVLKLLKFLLVAHWLFINVSWIEVGLSLGVEHLIDL